MADINKPSEKPQWATGAEAAVLTPSNEKQEQGWVVEYPPHQWFNWLAKWTYLWLEYLESRNDTGIGGSPSTLLTISGDSITPTNSAHSIDTEGSAATDDLRFINSANLADGRLLLIRTVSSSRVVTIKHLAGGTGQISTRNLGDVVLDSPSKWVLLMRTGTVWNEVFSSFLGSDPAPHLGGNLDVRARQITTSTTNGAIIIEPNGTGALRPNTTGKALGTTAARWNAFLGTANISGTVTLSGLTANRVLVLDASSNAVASGVTAAELNMLAGIGTTTVTNQLAAKANIAAPTFTGMVTIPTLNLSGMTENRVLISDSGKTVVPSAVFSTELAHLSGVTSAVQTQLNSKANLSGAAFTGTVTSAFVDAPTVNSTFNLGANNANIINIGRAGATTNFYGDLLNVQTTNTQVQDKNVTLNIGGNSTSGEGAGIDIQEGGTVQSPIVTGYIRVANSRNSWEFNVPGRFGAIRLTPSTASNISHEIISAATVNRAVTLPDAAGTVALVPASAGVVKVASGALTTAAVDLATAEVAGTLPVARGGTGVTASTGNGSNVLSTSPVLVTPNLGTPSAATLTNATGLPIVNGTTGVLTVARGGTGLSTLGTANQFLQVNGAGTGLVYSTFNGIAQGGNSLGAPMVIGANDNQPVIFRANNIDSFFISTSGIVTIGPAATGNGNGRPHVISGGLWAGNVTSSEASGRFSIGVNAHTNGGDASNNRTVSSQTGVVINMLNRSNNGGQCFLVSTNEINESNTTMAKDILTANAIGSWVLGKVDGTNTPAAHMAYGSFTAYQAATGTQNIFAALSNSTGGGNAQFTIRANGTIYVRPNNWGNAGGTAVLATNISADGGLLTLAASSIRYKKDIRPMTDEIDTSKVYDIDTKCFVYKDSGYQSFGAIAEEVHEILPCLVNWGTDGEGKPEIQSLAEHKLPWIMLEEMKKLKDEIMNLKTELASLKGSVK